jgi:predicted HicB family RNase H-like nuclease
VARPGRPPIYPHAASAKLQIRITPEQHAAVQRAAEEQGTSISGLVREMLDERIEDHRPFPGRTIRLLDGDDDAS